MFFGNFKKRIDKNGRIVIPKELVNDLGGEVVVAGCGDHIEIWTQERWAREQSRMPKILDKVMR